MLQIKTVHKTIFKNVEIDLLELTFDVIRDDFSNLHEIFRLEGRQVPLIKKNLILEYSDANFRSLLFMWESYANKMQRPQNLQDLNFDSLQENKDLLRLMRPNHNNSNFTEYDLNNYIDNKIFVPKGKTVFDMIFEKKSITGILYYTCLHAAMITALPVHTIHFSNEKNTNSNMWITMYLPFYGNNPNYPDNILMLQKHL